MTHTAYDQAQRLGFMALTEVALLQEYARKLPKGPLVINIGAGGGTSGLAFLQARPDLNMITVDVNLTGYGSLEGERNALTEAGLWGIARHNQILSDSSKYGHEWKKASVIDLIFIDADHSEEGCEKDILAWCPVVKVGGYVLLHDYKNLPLWPGVGLAVGKTLDTWDNWEQVEVLRTVAVYKRLS